MLLKKIVKQLLFISRMPKFRAILQLFSANDLSSKRPFGSVKRAQTELYTVPLTVSLITGFIDCYAQFLLLNLVRTSHELWNNHHFLPQNTHEICFHTIPAKSALRYVQALRILCFKA